MRITSALLSSVLDGQQLFGKRRKMFVVVVLFSKEEKRHEKSTRKDHAP